MKKLLNGETYNSKEVAQILGVQPKHIKRMVKANILPGAFDCRIKKYERINMRFVRIPEQDVQAFLNERRIVKDISNEENKGNN